MADHNDTGNKGEKLAADYLIKHGYKIVQTNWRSRHREVDIIATDGNIIVFVEVKTRSSDKWQAPQDSVDYRKRKLLIEAAGDFMESYEENAEVRFDVIAIELKNASVEIHHYIEAFLPDLYD